MDSSLCSSDNEILNFPENKKRNKLRKKKDLTDDLDLVESDHLRDREKKRKKSEIKNEYLQDQEEDDFISQNEIKVPNKSLAHSIFTRENYTDENNLKISKNNKVTELITTELEDEFLTTSDQGIVMTDVPERIIVRYLYR